MFSLNATKQNTLRDEQIIAIESELPGLSVKISKRARRLALRLDHTSRCMNLVVPHRMSLKKAQDFARNHESWIKTKLTELPSLIPFENGTTLPLFGQNTRLDIYYDTGLKRTSILLKNNKLLVKTNKSSPSGRITRYLKEQTRQEINDLAHKKAAQIDKEIENIQIRDTKSRWGSCGTKGRLSFSWRLIFAPWESLDYVVAHEVAHMVHLNHGEEFWSLCEELCEDYKTGKGWMREHGQTLMRYG